MAFIFLPLSPVLGGEGLGVRGVEPCCRNASLGLSPTPPHPPTPSPPGTPGERGGKDTPLTHDPPYKERVLLVHRSDGLRKALGSQEY